MDRTTKGRGDAQAQTADIGLIGLAVMGRNLALNMADKGWRVAVYNRTTATTEAFAAEVRASRQDDSIVPARTLGELVAALGRPRRVLLMVKAGPPVDAVIDELVPLLEAGDVIADCGNSFYRDTMRRHDVLSGRGLLYMGVGVSGGEEGARRGASIMPGGPREAWRLVEPVLVDLAARAPEDGRPCVAYIGPNGAGHFVKMVHNGIEYGDMQLIAEAYDLMRAVLGLSASEAAQVFARWNEGELASYLVEITADILRRVDPETGRPLVEVILDEAEQKGTGKWMSQESLEFGVSTPTITEAVFARFASAAKEERMRAAGVLPGPRPGCTDGGARAGELAEDDIRRALYASKICSYAQGFALLARASSEYGWGLDLATIARIWRAGCIIRARFLGSMAEALEGPGDRSGRAGATATPRGNILFSLHFLRAIDDAQASWRRVVGAAARAGVPVPAMSSALAWYDTCRREALPASLIQAQRDYFGAHTYRRLDRPGVFHTDWTSGD